MSDSGKKTRTVSKSRFTRTRKSLREAVRRKLIQETVKNRYLLLKAAWEDVQRCHEDYVASLEDPEAEEDWIDELAELFDETEVETDLYLSALEKEKVDDERSKNTEKQEEEENLRRLEKEKKENLKQEKDILMLALIREQENLQFQKLIETIETHLQMEAADGDRRHIAGTVDALICKLEDCFKRCSSSHQAYVVNIEDEEEREKETKWINGIIERFQRLYSRGKLYVSRESHEIKIEDNPPNTIKRGIRVESVRFEAFDGNIRRYPRFKEQFRKYVKPQYDATEEAFILRSYLSEDIRDEVDNLGEDAEALWQRLDQKYGDIGKIIESIMSDIKHLKKCDGSPARTIKMINVIEKSYRDLQYLQKEEEMNNSTIVSLIEEKLPEDVESEWVKLVTGDDRTEIGQEKFSHLLKLLLRCRERIEYKHANLRGGLVAKSREQTYTLRNSAERSVDTSNRRPWCWVHPDSNDHPIWRCEEFPKKTHAERLSLVKLNGACYSCLGQGHTANTCRRNFTCRVEGCNSSHHYLLHEAHVQGLSFHGVSESNFNRNTLLQLQKINGKNTNGKTLNINVLWDAGSTISFITFQKAQMLNLRGCKEHLQLIKVGGEVEEVFSRRYKLCLIDLSEETVEVDVLGLEKISTEIKAIRFGEVTQLFPPDELEDYSRPEGGEIDCLIGFDYAAFHPVMENSIGHLLLLKNRFGKIIGGRHPKIVERTRKLVHQATTYHIRVGFSDFYSCEQLGIDCNPVCGGCKCGKCHLGGKNMTLKEEQEYQLIEEGLIYHPEEERWESKLPMIKDPKNLPNNRASVLKMLHSTEKRLKKNPDHARVYSDQIRDMIDRGVCRKLDCTVREEYTGPIFYIPHHEVLKPDSKSTPCRIVFNSSANFRGHVLNEYYAKGPQMINNLLGILLRFREERFAIVGDIRKMYHSIKISLRDQMTHLFLWRDLDESRYPDEYAITAVNFGDKPSTAVAIAALQKTVDMDVSASKEARSAIKDNSYMDDILDSCPNLEEGRKLMKEIESILKRGGFHMKEWITSEEDERGTRGVEEEWPTPKEIEKERILGLEWERKRDEFHFKAKLNFSIRRRKIHLRPDLKRSEVPENIPPILTKRQILAQVNGIFDPLGLISPFTVKAKIMLRKLWGQDQKLGWDEEIPERFRKEWVMFFTELCEIEDLRFKRCVKPINSVADPTLIIFSDGSCDTYGAVAYVRWELDDGSYDVYLLVAKNRIAPLKVMDIVKLELSAAVVSKRLRKFILTEMRYNFKRVYHIIDSEIVKAMISKESYGFNTFAANRIGEIQQCTKSSEWYWMSGKLNVADCITRGLSLKFLNSDSVWQKGPAFLYTHEEDWPISCEFQIDDLPERPKQAFMTVNKSNDKITHRIDIERFSTLQYLLNTTARVVSLYRRFRKNYEDKSRHLQVVDVEKAEKMWIIEAQAKLKIDIEKGKLKRLCPRFQDDIIVVGGRTERWMSATWNHQSFILLPHNHRFSTLVIEDKHRKMGHLGIAATVAAVRSKFWILQIRKLATTISKSCVPCKKKFERLSGQVMSELPEERLKPAPAFASVGCDFFGPFVIKGEVQKRVRGKCFGVLFTCLVSRAVYVDISNSYSTDSFLQVMRRFSSLRGWPRYIYSDRGSQLVCASKELKEVIRAIDEDKVQRSGISYGTEWHFSSPCAPWMNGATESLVKSVKRAMHTCIGEQVLSFSELQTVVFECAQLVNQRPIGNNPCYPEDGSYICPNDLLLGRASPRTPQGPFKRYVSNKRRLDFIQELVSAFWKKWVRDCFPNMVMRPKWHTGVRNLLENDVVLIHDQNPLRGEWRMGIVKKPIASSDGRVRRVIVAYKNLTGKGVCYNGSPFIEVERAVHRLILLVPSDVESSEEVIHDENK